MAPWTGAPAGLPPFGLYSVEDFKQAAELAAAGRRRAIAAVSESRDAPSFANTIEPLERSNAPVMRVRALLNLHRSLLKSEEFGKAQDASNAVLSPLQAKLYQDERLYRRVEAVLRSSGLTPEQRNVASWYFKQFQRRGVTGAPAAKARINQIDTQLNQIYGKFSENLSAQSSELTFLSEDQMAGVSQYLAASAKSAAVQAGKPDLWGIKNSAEVYGPFLRSAINRAAREKVWRAADSTAGRGDAFDNNFLITDILRLRAERAKLTGYRSHAAYVTGNKMAGTPETARRLMEQVWEKALPAARSEVRDLQALAQLDGVKLQAWDVGFYSEKLRRQQYDFDAAELRPYLELNSLRDGLFWLAGQMYGFHFERLPGGASYHDEVPVWRVSDRAGQIVGFWYFDPWTRPGKDPGGWVILLQDQSAAIGPSLPIAGNAHNFARPGIGRPALIEWSDAVELFHEFGHALHALNSKVAYPTLAGVNVPSDFAEFPALLHERFLNRRDILSRFARHWQTGEPMPETLISKLLAAESFNQGIRTTAHVAAAMIDLDLHDLEPGTRTATDFEREKLQSLGLPPEIAILPHMTQFRHVFVGESYSAAYYSYIWSETLAADAFATLHAESGTLDSNRVENFRREILSVGGTADLSHAYRRVFGRDPSVQGLIRERKLEQPVRRASEAAR